MSDNLVIGGATFNNVTGIKATDTNDNIITFKKDGYRISTYTLASQLDIKAAITAAHIPLLAQDEVLILNIKGTNTQTSGSVTGKFNIVVVQDGVAISNASGQKRASAKSAPDSATPNSSWTNGYVAYVQDGYYYNSGNSMYFVAAGNTLEFIQIPYDVGWSV